MKSLSLNALDIDRMESEFQPSFMQNALVFKQLDPDLYAFRGKTTGRNNSELMHGLILFDQTQLQVTVKGYFDVTNLIVLIFTVYVAFSFFQGWGFLLALILLILMGMMYFPQIKRYRKVAEKAAELVATYPQAI
jgi:hypothetical protein